MWAFRLLMTSGKTLLNAKVLVPAGIAAAAFLVGWTANGWRLSAEIHQIHNGYSQKIAEESQAALERYADLEAQKQEALDEARRRAEEQATLAADTLAERDRLREQLAANRNRLTTESPTSVDQYTDTLAAVLDECAVEIEIVARKADGHVRDVQMLLEAWPQ